MTVENNSAIAIDTLSDWLKNLEPVFQPMKTSLGKLGFAAKPKPIAPCTRDFSCALNKLHVIARNSDWSITLSAPAVIGRSNNFDIGFSTVI